MPPLLHSLKDRARKLTLCSQGKLPMREPISLIQADLCFLGVVMHSVYVPPIRLPSNRSYQTRGGLADGVQCAPLPLPDPEQCLSICK